MSTVTLSCGKSFVAAPGQSLLDAASQFGVHLPYSCKTGRCNTCRCRLISGQTTANNPEIGLSKQERDQGWILSCVREALSDCQIETQNVLEIDLPKPRVIPCKVDEILYKTKDIIQVFLRLPPSVRLQFLPGQYVSVTTPEGHKRSYSLANSDASNHRVELHIKIVPDGKASDYWFNKAKKDDLLRLEGPLGTFFLRTQQQTRAVFLATGTGIAPVVSILRSIHTLPEAQRPLSIDLYWGARHEQGLYLDLAAELSTPVRYHPVLSRPTGTWQGETGHVQTAFLASQPDLVNTIVYACGSELMIQSAQKTLEEASLPSTQFFSDAFVCTAASTTQTETT